VWRRTVLRQAGPPLLREVNNRAPRLFTLRIIAAVVDSPARAA
jgi:hypothetical protein